ncbi:MAG: YgjV family protein [Butyrivibrio sp.]|nr:YgjV family protein [Butyrivibrio sp.]
MNTQTIIELIGYLGSALVLVSFLMVSVYKLRIVNSIGSVVCVIYGLIIHAYPTVVMNLCLVAINVYYLVKMINTQKNYDLVKVNGDEGLTRYTIDKYKDDIAKCFPGISMNFDKANRGYVVCHDGKPVGVMLGEEKDRVLDIMLDYSIPQYRDFSIGAFLMSSIAVDGIDKLIYTGSDENHKEYLKRTGFSEVGDHYEKVL